MTYQDIEVIVTKDEKKVKLTGQVNNIHYENPIVTIFGKEGNIGTFQTPPYSMKLSKLMYELGIIQSAAYSFKEFRPTKFSISINVGEAKK